MCNHAHLYAAVWQYGSMSRSIIFAMPRIHFTHPSYQESSHIPPSVKYITLHIVGTVSLRLADLTLLHQAYAKLHGTYESINGGSVGEALVDLTGGSCEKILLANGE